MTGEIVYKLTGSGNDFLFVDGRRSPLADWPPERIRRVCRRRLSLGADGLAVLEPASEPGRVRFHFFNSDGGRAAMCGNAALCATRLAAWLRMAPHAGMELETDAGVFHTRCLPDDPHAAEIILGDVQEVSEPGIEADAGEESIAFAMVGVPHLVVRVSGDLQAVDLPNRGRELRFHPALGSAGANVNFIGQGPDGWAMRTWERGVEAETLACGTGAVACAAVLLRAGEPGPIRLRSASGSVLTVSGTSSDTPPVLAGATLAGEGRLVYRAVLTAE